MVFSFTASQSEGVLCLLSSSSSLGIDFSTTVDGPSQKERGRRRRSRRFRCHTFFPMKGELKKVLNLETPV